MRQAAAYSAASARAASRREAEVGGEGGGVPPPPPAPAPPPPSRDGRARGRPDPIEDDAAGEVGQFSPRGGREYADATSIAVLGLATKPNSELPRIDGRLERARESSSMPAVNVIFKDAESVTRDARLKKPIPGQLSEPQRQDGVVIQGDRHGRRCQHAATGAAVERCHVGRSHVGDERGKRLGDEISSFS